MYIDSHEPEESIRSLLSAGYTEAENGNGLRGSIDFGVVYHYRSSALTGCLLSARALSRYLGDNYYF